LHWLHPELASRPFQADRRRRFFALQQKAVLFVKQAFAFAPQRFCLVTISQCRKVKSARVQEPSGQR